jgi:N utilization substance protein B
MYFPVKFLRLKGKKGFPFCIFMYIIDGDRKGLRREREMTRNNAREIAVQMIFELTFGNRSVEALLEEEFTKERFAEIGEECALYAEFPNAKQERYIKELVRGVYAHGPELDTYIERYAVGWAFARIPRMAASILRTAMYEVLYMQDIPNAAALNEAVEIAKKYEDDKTVSFLNGILGTFSRTELPE